MRLSRAIVIMVVTGGLALSACSVSVGGKSVDVENVERTISDKATAQTGVRPKEVECPDKVAMDEGHTFRCSLTAPDGSVFGATVTITEVDGDQFDYRFAVDDKPQGAAGNGPIS